jgi:hypothetical protein
MTVPDYTHYGEITEHQATYGKKSLQEAIAEWKQSSAELRKSMGEPFKALKDSTLS